MTMLVDTDELPSGHPVSSLYNRTSGTATHLDAQMRKQLDEAAAMHVKPQSRKAVGKVAWKKQLAAWSAR
jgi:hypothetical protein